MNIQITVYHLACRPYNSVNGLQTLFQHPNDNSDTDHQGQQEYRRANHSLTEQLSRNDFTRIHQSNNPAAVFFLHAQRILIRSVKVLIQLWYRGICHFCQNFWIVDLGRHGHLVLLELIFVIDMAQNMLFLIHQEDIGAVICRMFIKNRHNTVNF